MNLKTRLRSFSMRYLSSASFLEKQRDKARRKIRRSGRSPTVHYFHQVDDPYSHLAVQKLDELRESYGLAFTPHLVSSPGNSYKGSYNDFDKWAYHDAQAVAADYNTHFQPTVSAPAQDAIESAQQILAAQLSETSFATTAVQIGNQLWSNEPIEKFVRSNATSDRVDSLAHQAVADGNALRKKLGHYQGAMFYFEGEWFWGLDRVRSLEFRLQAEGYGLSNKPLCVPEPRPIDTTDIDASNILLEYFPSLRSPYTAIGHKFVLDLVERSGASFQVRPVMPMLMRGIPAPSAKQRYIITDAGREGRERNHPLGKIVDPFGPPVTRAFAMLPAAIEQNREVQFVTEYIDAAWFEGLDITSQGTLNTIAKRAGMNNIDIIDTETHTSPMTSWETLLDENLSAMLSHNLWGVPSFRVSGGNNQASFACWGQDRLWRVENEIARRV